MRKQDAQEFFARNPSALESMDTMRRDGSLGKLDSFYLGGSASSERHAMVNCIEAFRVLNSINHSA
jgi:hypothetical protein